MVDNKSRDDHVQEYLIEKKVHDAIRRYIQFWVAPPILVLLGALGYLGVKVEKASTEIQAAIDLQKVRAGEVQRLMKETEGRLDDIDKTLTAAAERQRLKVEGMGLLLDKKGSQVQEILQSQMQTLAQMNRNIGSSNVLFDVSRKQIDAANEAMSTTAQMAKTRVEELDKRIANTDRTISAHIVDTVTLRSGATATVRLPRANGGSSTLYLEVGDIDKETNLFYRVDNGVQHRVRLHSDQKQFGAIEVPDVSGLYELQPDIVFYAKGGSIHDFMILRVRRVASKLLDY